MSLELALERSSCVPFCSFLRPKRFLQYQKKKKNAMNDSLGSCNPRLPIEWITLQTAVIVVRKGEKRVFVDKYVCC